MVEPSFEGALIAVTTPTIPGYSIKEVKGLVWASTVRAKFFLKDLIALTRVFLGGEVNEYVELVNEARQEILFKLNENAKEMHANAIVGVSLATAQIIPGTIEILASGTAVVIEKE